MAKHRVEIYLDDKEEKFLKWLVNYDNSEDSKDHSPDTKWTLSKEINALAGVKIQETMDFYKKEGTYNDNI